MHNTTCHFEHSASGVEKSILSFKPNFEISPQGRDDSLELFKL